MYPTDIKCKITIIYQPCDLLKEAYWCLFDDAGSSFMGKTCPLSEPLLIKTQNMTHERMNARTHAD